MEYIRLGPGSMPNSSRYKIKLILYRDKGGVQLSNQAMIYVRGDARYPFNSLVESNPTTAAQLTARFGNGNAFARDFAILPGSPVDTLTVRPQALTEVNDVTSTTSNHYFTGWSGEYALQGNLSLRFPNTSIAGVSTIPGYEYSAYNNIYPAKQFMADRSTPDGITGFGWVRQYDVSDNSSLVDTCTEVISNTFEVKEYTRVVDLPNIPGGYHVFSEISARNGAVLNVRSPGAVGFTVYTRIPDIALLDTDADSFTKLYNAYSAAGMVTTLGTGSAFSFAGSLAGVGQMGGYLNDRIRTSSITGVIKDMQASSPRFISRPPSFVCGTDPVLFKTLGKNPNNSANLFQAFDYDGDRLEYEVVSASAVKIDAGTGSGRDYPFTGTWKMPNATVDGASFIGTDRLYPTMPYTNLVYPYSVNIATFKPVQYQTFAGASFVSAEFPMGLVDSVPGIVIDKNTGKTTLTPLFDVSSGDKRVVTSIRVREFRNVTVPGSALSPSVPGAGFFVREALMGQINIDYQFLVKKCPLPSLAFMAPTIGCFKPNSSNIQFTYVPNSTPDPINNLYWDFGRDRYTVTGIKNLTNPGLSAEMVRRVAPNGSIVNTAANGGVSDPTFFRTGKTPTYSFPGVGSYFVKLVVQLNSDNRTRNSCSDSAFSLVNVSVLRSGYTVTGGPICINIPIDFNPFATGSATGFTTTSGSSLYTNINTNPIPLIVKRRRDSAGIVLYTYLGAGFWMQPNGTRDTIAPDPSIIAPSKILNVKYGFGNGATQTFTRTLSTNAWVTTTSLLGQNITITGPFPQAIPNTRVTITGLAGPLNNSIPGIRYAYPDSITNANSYLIVRNQFGCSDSVSRNVTVVKNFPTARIVTPNVCENVTTLTVQGFTTTANRGIWSGLGTFLPINPPDNFSPGKTVTATGVTTILGGLPGFVLNSIYQPTLAELSVVGLNPYNSYTSVVLSTTGIPECPAAVSTVAGIQIFQKPFVDAGPAEVLLCKNNLQYKLNATVSGARTPAAVDAYTGVWTVITGSGSFSSTGTQTSTMLGDVFSFSTSVTSVVLRLSAQNIGSCLPTFDVITLAGGPQPLPVINAANNFTVNGLINAYNVCANNPNITISGTMTFAGIRGIWTTTSAFPGTIQSVVSTPIPGLEAYRVTMVYLPSAREITTTGFVDLRLSTDIILGPTNCNNVSQDVRINIGNRPVINFATTSPIGNINSRTACANNAIFTISGTVLGAGGFTLNVGNGGILAQLSGITGTASGYNTAYAGNFTYIPSAGETTVAGANALLASFISTNNGNCLAVDTTVTLFLNPPPTARITTTGIVLDSIRLCNNNAFADLRATNLSLFTPTALLRWFSSGNGSFSSATGAINTTYTSSQNDTLNGNVRFILEANRNGCFPTYDSLHVKYFNSPQISAGSDLSICENLLTGTLSGIVSLPASGGIWATNGAGGTFGSTAGATTTKLNDTYIPTVTEVSNGPITLTLSSTGINIGTAQGKCLPRSSALLVSFTPKPAINFGAVLTVNENNSLANFNATIVGINVTGSTSAIWGSSLNTNAASYDPSRTNFLYSAAAPPNMVGSVKYTPILAEILAKNVVMNITVSGANNCAPVINSTQLFIAPKPTATILGKGLSVCANNNTINLNATVTGARSGLWSGGENTITSPYPGFSATYMPSTNEINQKYVDLYFTSAEEFFNANSVRDTIRVGINPPPIADILVNSISICGNALSADFPATVTGALGMVWTTSGSGQFFVGGVLLVGSVTGTSATIEYRPSASDKLSTGAVKITMTSAGNGGCNPALDIANLYFTPSPVANAGSDFTWCLNDPAPIALNASGGAGSWSSSRPGGSFGGATLQTTSYTPTPAPGIITFTWTTNATTGCPSVSDNAVVTVLSSPSILITLPNETVCGNSSSLALNATITGGTGAKWRTGGSGGSFTSSATQNGADLIGITVATGNAVADTYTFSAADKAAGFVNLTISGLGTSPCNSVQSVKRITITPIITADAGPGFTLCATAGLVISLTGNVKANGVVDNSRNGTWSVVGAGLGTFSNANTRITSFTPTANAILNAPQSITFVFSPTIDGSCLATRPSDAATYTFRTPPSLKITSNPIQVCSDTSFIQLTATFSGTSSIVWSTTGSNTALNWVSSKNSLTSPATVRYFPMASDLTKSSLDFVISSNGSAECSDASSLVFPVTITTKPTVVLSGPNSICDNIAQISFVGSNMTVSGVRPIVNWYVYNSTTPTSTAFNFPSTITTNNVGSTTTYSPTSADKLNGSVTVFLDITGPPTCKSQSFTKVINFTPGPTVNVGSATSNLCSDTPAITLIGTSLNATVAGWSTTVVGIGSFSSNGYRAVFVPNAAGRTLAGIDFRFTTSLAGCNDVFAAKTITLAPASVVSITSPFIFCGDKSVVTLTGAYSSTNAAQMNSSFGGTFSASYQPILFAPTASSINSAAATGTAITVTITSANNGNNCGAATAVSSVFFTPRPTITGGPAVTICASNSVILLSSATGVSGSSNILGYRWSTSGGNTASGLGGIFTLTGLSTSTGLSQVYQPGSIEKTGFTILNISTTGVSGGCDNVSAQKTINYDKAATFASLPNQTKCANNSILDINVNPNDFSSIKWSSNTSKLPSGGAFLSEVATATTYFPGTLDLNTKMVTISGTVLGMGQCINNPAVQSFVLSITSAPIITVISPLNICSEVSTVQLSAIANISTTGLSWQNTTSSISGVYSVNRFVGRPIYAVTATDVSNGTIQFEVTGNYGNCGPVSEAVQLNIAPKPTINAGSDRVLCADVTQSSIKLTFTGQNFTKGQWIRLGGAGGGNFGNPVIDQAAIAPSSNGDQDFVYYFANSQDSLQKIINLKVNTVDQNGLCAVASDVVNITLVSPPVITPGVGTNYCETLQVITLTGSVVGPETYTYQWQGLFGNQNGTFSGSNATVGIAKTYAGSANDFYNTGDLDEDKYVFNFNVTGTGICKFESIGAYKMTFNIQPITKTSIVEGDFNVCADADEITITGMAQYANLIPQGLIPTFIGKNFNGIASGAAQYQPSKSPPHIYDGNLGGFKTQLRYRIFQNDITAGGVNFVLNVNNLTNSTTCPPTSAISNVTLLSAPIVSVTGPPSACSNNVVITVSGFSSTGAGTWSSTTAVANRGTFISVVTLTGSPNTIAGVYSISGDEFDNKFVSLLFKSESNGLCKQISRSVIIPLKEKPVIDAGVDGTVCNLNLLTLTGTITNPITASGIYGWRIVSMNSVLGAALATITGSGFPSSNIIFNSVTGVDLQLVSTVFNPNGAVGDNKVTFELSATDATCNVVAKQISFTVTGATALNAGSLVSTICGSDPLKMNPSSSSEKGVWSTSGAGYFASGGFGAKTTQIMNDLYIPASGEFGLITFTLSTIPGSTNSCLIKTPSTATAFLSNGINVNSGASQFINICYNYNPIMAGTILGTNKAYWKSTGTGTFESSTTFPGPSVNETTTLTSNVKVVTTVVGSITASGYAFEDIYIPSQTDKDGGKVIVYLQAVNDNVTQCKIFSKDSLTIYFTKPPFAKGGMDVTVCATDAIANGIPLKGRVTMPSPNSSKAGQLPNNAARWKILTASPGSPLSSIPGVFSTSVSKGNAVNTATGLGEFAVTSIIGDGFNGVEFDVNDSYFPSVLDTISTGNSGFRALYLALEADNVTIFGINTVTSTPILCNAVIDTIRINFLTPAYAQVTNFTSTGICSDQTEIAIDGRYSRAFGLLWTTTGGGIVTSNSVDNSKVNYTLSQNELDTDIVKVIRFSPIPIPDPNDAVVCISPIASIVTVTVNPKPILTITGSGQTICADNQSISLVATNIRTTTGTLPLNYRWILGGTGTVLGPDLAVGTIIETNNFVRTLNYKVSDDDIAAKTIGFLFSTSGPNTCKPQLFTDISLNINPLPVIVPSLNKEICRDNILIPISLLSIQHVSTVQWVVSRRDLGSAVFTVLGASSNPGTLSGGGALAQSVNATLVGDNINAAAISYFTSAYDRASAAELVFSVTSLVNVPNNSLPACNQVVRQVSVSLTDTPIVTITSALAGGNICSNETSISLNGTISGFGNLSGIWQSDRFGFFTPSSAITPADLAANAYKYFLDDRDRNFTTLGITLSVTGLGTCIDVYKSTNVFTVTAAPQLNAGANDSVCADLKSIALLNSTQKNADNIFGWITFGTGSFTGNSFTAPGEYFYMPSAADSANGAVTVALIVPNKVTCNPDSSFKTIRFSIPPKIIAIDPAFSLRQLCADNDIPLNASVDNRTSQWVWTSIKNSTLTGQQFFLGGQPGAGVRGQFLDANNATTTSALTGKYTPSAEDTLGVNRNDSPQLVTLRLVANGVGVCSVRTFTSDINVTFTPRPNIYLAPLDNICKNDNRPISLTGYFLNTIAGRMKWSSSPAADAKFSDLYSYFPPTVVGVSFIYDQTDKTRGIIQFNIVPENMGTCKSSIDQAVKTVKTVRFIDGPILSPSNPTPYCADVVVVSLGGINVNSVVGTAQWRTAGSGVFTSSNTILGTTLGISVAAGQRRTRFDNYIPSAIDKAQKQVNLFIYSTTQTDNCPPDTAKITLKFDDVPIVTAAVDGSSVCAGQVITLSGTIKNHAKGVWETISAIPGVGTGPITPANTTIGTVFYAMSQQDINSTQDSLSQLRFRLTSIQENGNKCIPRSDTATINIYKKPVVNAGSPSVCTIDGIKLSGSVAFAVQSVWTTTGKGVFSPSKFDKSATYVPDSSDIRLGSVRLSLIGQGIGPCDQTSSSIQLNLKANPLPLANAGPDEVVCDGDLFRLNVSNLSPFNSYQWLVPTVTAFNTTVLSPLADRNITALTVRVGNTAKYVLEVTDNTLGCVNSDTINLQSLLLPSLAMRPRVCFDDQLILAVGSTFTKREGKFQWFRNGVFLGNENSPDRIRAIVTGDYTLEYTENATQCSVRDTTNVRPLPLLKSKGKVVCDNAPFSVTSTVLTVVGADITKYTYNWNVAYNRSFNPERFNGATDTTTLKTNTLTGLAISRDSAIYVIQVVDTAFNLGCTAYDSARVKTHPVPDMQVRNVNACIGDIVSLDATPLNVETPKFFRYLPSSLVETVNGVYLWTSQLGVVDSAQWYRPRIRLTYEKNGTGLYIAKFQIGECLRRDSSVVNFNAKPIVENLGAVPYCVDDKTGITIDAGGREDTLKYLWLASGNTRKTELVYDTAKYYVRIANNVGCAYVDSITVRNSCDPKVFVPEGFIPDGDSDRDKFLTIFGRYFDNIEFSIYNRWGELVYFTKDKDFMVNNGWDGKYGGSKLPFGIYPYILKYRGLYKEQQGKNFEKRGSVTIVR